MKSDETQELLSLLELLGGICEDLTQRVVALENSLSGVDRERWKVESKNLKGRGNITNVALALEVLRGKILPNQ
jgi:hypothetical protein